MSFWHENLDHHIDCSKIKEIRIEKEYYKKRYNLKEIQSTPKYQNLKEIITQISGTDQHIMDNKKKNTKMET